jgi:REP element-mobilizing transposase RayT
MVIAHHLIWTAYGWWLPNDPRGSNSKEIRVERIADLGELHYGRKLVQPLPADLRAFYAEAEKVLKHELLTFDDDAIAILAESFAQTIRDAGYTCYSCAIMQDHVHMLVRRHRDKAEEMIKRFQVDSRDALIAANMRPREHPTWGGPGWKVFLNTEDDIRRVDGYIRDNPKKANRPEQNWPFVKVYDGWLPLPAKR